MIDAGPGTDDTEAQQYCGPPFSVEGFEMPTSKLFIAGVLALGALGIGLGSQLNGPRYRAIANESGKQGAGTLGYLSASEVPDATALVPPPPAAGSAAIQRDEKIRQAALLLQGTPRYQLAASDAVRTQSNTVRAFECAFGTEISPERTPALYRLLLMLRLDVREVSYRAKGHYARPRPYVVHHSRTCYPDDEAMTRNDGSYPSARSAVGWSYALVLSELNPARADAILQRGRDFGQSRVVCDQEWQSDVDAGRSVATVTVGRLEANDAFKADLEKARKEVAAQLASGARLVAAKSQSEICSG